MIPTPSTNVDFYVVPAGTQTVVSVLAIANRGSSTSAGYDIIVVPAGQTFTSKNYIASSFTVPGNETTVLTLGITMAAGDKILINTSSTNLSFSAFGVEFS